MPVLMKGNVWHKRKHKVTYPVIVERKHDEIRCHVLVTVGGVKFLSYAGKPLANMDRFASKMIELAAISGQAEFDLGFEVNGNFNDSYRWVRSTKGLPDDLLHADTRFYLFDLPNYELPYKTRRAFIEEIATSAGVHTVFGVLCRNEVEVEAAYESYRSQGYEGAMIKNPEHMYAKGKRTDDWLKMKPEEDGDGIIISLEEAVCGKDQPELGLFVGDRLGRIGSVTVRCEDGSNASPHGIPHDLGRDMMLHPEKYIGQWCEFKFMERDRQGGYRHNVFHRLRESK